MAFSSIGKVNLTEIYDFHLDPRLHHEIRKKQPLANQPIVVIERNI